MIRSDERHKAGSRARPIMQEKTVQEKNGAGIVCRKKCALHDDDDRVFVSCVSVAMGHFESLIVWPHR